MFKYFLAAIELVVPQMFYPMSDLKKFKENTSAGFTF